MEVAIKILEMRKSGKIDEILLFILLFYKFWFYLNFTKRPREYECLGGEFYKPRRQLHVLSEQ